LRFYNATRCIFPRSYTLRMFLLCFVAVHVPIATFAVVQLVAGEWDWGLFLPLLLGTVAGSAMAIAGLAGLLAPIREATVRLARMQRGQEIDPLPTGGPDLAGQLLNAVAHAAHATAIRMDRLRGAAATDPLTGLRNRRGFQETVLPLLRDGVKGTIALIDGDRFKLVNDQLGHAEGDRVLRTLATRIAQNIRSTDIAARWGGDEFVVFFEELDIAAAARVVGRIRESMHQRPPAEIDGVPITFSFGLALLKGPGRRRLDKALQAADGALYEVKRNRAA